MLGRIAGFLAGASAAEQGRRCAAGAGHTWASLRVRICAELEAMIRFIAAGLLVSILSACAVCGQHPLACSVAGTILVGSLEAGLANARGQQVSYRCPYHVKGMTSAVECF